MDLPAQWTGEGTSLALSPGQDPAWKKNRNASITNDYKNCLPLKPLQKYLM